MIYHELTNHYLDLLGFVGEMNGELENDLDLKLVYVYTTHQSAMPR
jgi:hypothetical protein